jgi:hypothetical protein
LTLLGSFDKNGTLTQTNARRYARYGKQFSRTLFEGAKSECYPAISRPLPVRIEKAADESTTWKTGTGDGRNPTGNFAKDFSPTQKRARGNEFIERTARAATYKLEKTCL